MITYILKTINNEYYCGKTNNLIRRLLEHKNNLNMWFKFNNRNNFKLIFKVNGDYEKRIKKFGVKEFIKLIKASHITTYCVTTF